MKILIINPARNQVHTGNHTTAERWAGFMRELGQQADIAPDWTGSTQLKDYDVLVALHARKSFPALDRFHRAHPETPVVVALTGTDVYQDLESSSDARQSLAIAARLIVLQPQALERLPASLRSKCRVIYQSAKAPAAIETPLPGMFRACVLAHLRAVKDPLRAAYAARDLPAGSRVQVVHAGGALDADLASEAEAEQRRNPRYRWLGDVSRKRALELLAGSQVLVLSSLLEGGANVVSEALASEVPVLSTRIPGSTGILGEDYPGYFPAGDTRALCLLMQKAASDAEFYDELKQRVRALKPLVDPRRERESWRSLLVEVADSPST